MREFGPQPIAALPAPHSSGRDIDLGDLPRMLWRRKWIVIGVLLAGIIATRMFVGGLAPVYSATAQIMIAPGAPVLDVHAVAAALRGDAEDIASEVYVLRSRDLAARVAEALNLEADPEFNPLLRPAPKSTWDNLREALNLPAPAASEANANGGFPELTDEQRKSLVVNGVLGRLQTVPVGRSRVIAVTAQASSGEKAAKIANAVVDQYLRAQIDSKRSTTGTANTWLTARAHELEKEVRARERAVEAYRSRAGLTRGAGSRRLTDEEASGLSTQLVLARGESAAARARLAQVEKLLESSGPQAVGDVLDAPLVRSMREQRATAQRELARMREEYGPMHPRVVAAQAQIADTESAIDSEVNKLVQGLRNEAAVADARQSALSGSLEGLKARSGREDASEVELRALEREAESSRTLLETFLTRAKETSAQSTMATADARIISRASVPFGPAFPNPPLLMMIGAVAALGVGIMLALLREGLDRTVRTTGMVERHLGVTVLGTLPLLRKRSWRGLAPAQWVLRAPHSEYSEALRRLHTGLLLGDFHAPPRVVLLCSSLPGEGKTTTVLALGRLLAGTGQRVVALDLNLRRPTLHRAVGLKEGSIGLGEWYEAGGDAIADFLQHDARSALRVLPVGALRADPGVLLRSPRFAKLLDRLRADFDVVLIDSSPVLAVVDAQILACLADVTVLLVRAGSTSRDAANEAFDLLTRARGTPPEVVLNGAPTREDLGRRRQGLGAYYDDRERPKNPPRRLLGGPPMPPPERA